MRRAAIFTRVSTDRQTTANQLQRLREVAERAGWHLVEVYEEVVSGAAARGRRAAYDRMLKDATRRRFEVLLAWDVSRLGRSLRELLDCFETLRKTGVDLYLDQQGVDTTTPAGRALFGMAGVFAEFERSMLIERTRVGLDRARAQGKRLGRPITPDHVARRVLELRRAGVGDGPDRARAGHRQERGPANMPGNACRWGVPLTSELTSASCHDRKSEWVQQRPGIVLDVSLWTGTVNAP